MNSHGVDKVVAVTVNTPDAVQQLAAEVIPDGSLVCEMNLAATWQINTSEASDVSTISG